jgi:hypothetical protein
MLIRGSTILIVTVCTLAACDRNKPDDAFPPEPKSVTNTSANVNTTPGAGNVDPISAATNAATVTRYDDESPMKPMKSKLVPMTTARTTPLGKQAVAIMETGCDATAVAKKGDYFLAVFPDPKDSSKQLAGWIYKDGLDIVGAAAKVPGPPTTFTCKAGDVHVLNDGLCAKICAHDADCASVGGVCDGNGAVATSAHAVGHAQYCIAAPQ